MAFKGNRVSESIAFAGNGGGPQGLTTSGSTPSSGGNGGPGVIIVREYYQ